MRARGHAGVQGDPADVPAHDLGDHAAAVRVAGRAQTVHRLGRDLHRGVEAEGVVGRGEVVVDGLRHAHDRMPASVRRFAAASVPSPPIAMSASTPSSSMLCDALGRRRESKGLVRRGAEDRAALLGDAHDLRAAERHDVALDDALPAVAEADELHVVVLDALEHRAADDRVEAGAVAAARQDADLHGSLDSLLWGIVAGAASSGHDVRKSSEPRLSRRSWPDALVHRTPPRESCRWNSSREALDITPSRMPGPRVDDVAEPGCSEREDRGADSACAVGGLAP